jgi:hypothetical protein
MRRSGVQIPEAAPAFALSERSDGRQATKNRPMGSVLYPPFRYAEFCSTTWRAKRALRGPMAIDLAPQLLTGSCGGVKAVPRNQGRFRRPNPPCIAWSLPSTSRHRETAARKPFQLTWSQCEALSFALRNKVTTSLWHCSSLTGMETSSVRGWALPTRRSVDARTFLPTSLLTRFARSELRGAGPPIRKRGLPRVALCERSEQRAKWGDHLKERTFSIPHSLQ